MIGLHVVEESDRLVQIVQVEGGHNLAKSGTPLSYRPAGDVGEVGGQSTVLSVELKGAGTVEVDLSDYLFETTGGFCHDRT